jgi:hypothetical protein
MNSGLYLKEMAPSNAWELAGGAAFSLILVFIAIFITDVIKSSKGTPSKPNSNRNSQRSGAHGVRSSGSNTQVRTLQAEGGLTKMDLKSLKDELRKEMSDQINSLNAQINSLEKQINNSDLKAINKAESASQSFNAFNDVTESNANLPQKATIEVLLERLNQRVSAPFREIQISELNITRESDDEIQKGRTTNTKLEQVTGGGSYLHVHLGEEDWLLPTERTLDGFRTHQIQKGIFEFRSEGIQHPLVDKAARLQAEGDLWVVVERGEIFVPG